MMAGFLNMRWMSSVLFTLMITFLVCRCGGNPTEVLTGNKPKGNGEGYLGQPTEAVCEYTDSDLKVKLVIFREEDRKYATISMVRESILQNASTPRFPVNRISSDSTIEYRSEEEHKLRATLRSDGTGTLSFTLQDQAFSFDPVKCSLFNP